MALLLVMAGSSFAQIPNAGFENWTSGNPVSWDTNNGLYTFITQSSSAHGGVSAAQGAVVNIGAFNMSGTLMSATTSGVGFAISQRYGSLRGFYKFTPVNGDAFFVSYLDQKGTSGVGAGSYLDLSAQSVYKEFIATILYPGADIPDNAVITFSITHPGGFPNVGSTFVVDDLTFGVATGMNATSDGPPKAFRLGQNYPNPFNPMTNIVYDVPEQSHIVLTVLDMLGREVAVVVNQFQSAGRYKAVFNASALTSGVYFYRLTAGSFADTRKLTVLR
ncbi:MAG: T9SS type A sorting domain-containing protein [Bacteroidota bacterium]